MNHDGREIMRAQRQARSGQPTSLRKVLAERVWITARCEAHLPELFRDAKFMVEVTHGAADRLVATVQAYLMGIPKERIDVERQWPADWWQAFRERWFPGWWLWRWPVRYERLEIHKTIYGPVCPHLRMPGDKLHLEWLAQDEGDRGDDGNARC